MELKGKHLSIIMGCNVLYGLLVYWYFGADCEKGMKSFSSFVRVFIEYNDHCSD